MSNSDLPTLLVTGQENEPDDRPLPLIVAEKWGFPLAYIEYEKEIYYAVQDWIGGVTGSDAVRKNLEKNEML